MTKLLNTHARASYGAFASRPMYPGAPRIAFAPEGGAGGSDDGQGGEDGNEGEGGAGDNKSGDDQNKDSGKDDQNKDGQGSKDDDQSKNKGKTDDEKAELLREVMEKKNSIKELKDQLKKFDGIDPEAVRALLKEKKDAELAAEEAKGNFDRVKQMMVEAHENDKKALTDTIAELQGQLSARDGELDKLTVGQSFALSNFIAEELTLTPSKAKKVYGEHFERVDGVVVAYDKPASEKDRTVLTGADGKPLSFDDALRRLVDIDPDKERLIKQKIAPGAGSNSKRVEADQKKGAEGGKRLYGVNRILAGLEGK